MEGNFRIVQLSDNEFVIEKECINEIKYPWYTFKKNINKSNWKKVNSKGTFILTPWDVYYKSSNLKICQDKLRQILKFPKIIEYATGNSVFVNDEDSTFVNDINNYK